MTPREIYQRAVTRSKRFVPEGRGVTATPEEIVPVVQDSLHAAFQVASRVNPTFFGARKEVTYSDGWPRPAEAEAVERIERESGEEVVIVPHDQRQAEPGFPCVFRWGQRYYPAGVTPGPETSETLVFLYSRVPAMLSGPDDPIDAEFPRSHVALLELDVAIRIALKDGGPSAEIAPALMEERRDALRRYVAFLEHETIGERRSYGLLRKFTTNTLVPLNSLLAGGAA